MEHYQLFTVESVQKDEAAILAVLRGIKESRLSDDLKLLNYFKEIPVSFPATVNQVLLDAVEFTVHRSQAVAMLDQKMAFVRSSHLPYDVVAKVQRVRLEKQIAVLGRFSYAHIRSERRENVRVKAVGDFDVVFKGADFSLRGKLRDISLTGLSFVGPETWDIGDEVAGEATLFLPASVVDIPAKLLRILGDSEGKCYVLKLEPTHRVENAIAQFIFHLQTEIIKELKARS